MITPVDDVPRAFSDVVVGAFVARPGPRFTLVLSGGPTARACYELLSGSGGIDWTVVDVYVGDERVVPPDDEDSNARLIREALLDRVGPVGSFSPMPTEGPVAECVAAYQRTMTDVVTGAGIDLIHLGMGPDGHTASLFPAAPTLDADPGTLVLATEDRAGNNPHPRLTLTLPAINSARLAVFTVAGASKADAVAALLHGEHLVGGEVRGGEAGRRLGEGAVAAAVAAQHGERNEDLGREGDAPAVCAVAHHPGQRGQVGERGVEDVGVGEH